MAPATFLTKELQKFQSDRYTPAAANEARTLIEDILGEKIQPGDLLEALKDGVVLCKLVNKAVPGTLRFNVKPQMPFIQMENISLFLEACKHSPFNLQSHDIFLTVDLYESKNPAQVLVCLGAFSRAAHRIDPARFPNPTGTRFRISPEATGTPYETHRDRRSDVLASDHILSTLKHIKRPVLIQSKTGDERTSSRIFSTKAGVSISSEILSLTKMSEEKILHPPWSIAQYGYLGGASQGNLGVSFGGRRQITSTRPHFPSAAEKERKFNETEFEKQRLQREMDEVERRRQQNEVAEKEKARSIEEKKRIEAANRIREKESMRVEEENRKWEEEEIRWRLQEENQLKEDREFEASIMSGSKSVNNTCNSHYSNQFPLKKEEKNYVNEYTSNPESNRVKELERELELARKREREYEQARRLNCPEKTVKLRKNSDPAPQVVEKNQPLSSIYQLSASPHKYSDETLHLEKHNPVKKEPDNKGAPDPFLYSSRLSGAKSSPNLKSTRLLPEPKHLKLLSKQQTGSRQQLKSVQSQLLPKQQTGSRLSPKPSESFLMSKQQTVSRPLAKSEPALSHLLPKQQTGTRPLPESAQASSLPQHNTGLRSPAESEPVQPQLLPKQRTGPRPLPEIAQPQLLPKKQTGSRPLPESTLPRSLPHHNTGLRSPAESEPVQPQLLPKQRTGPRPLPEIAQPQLLPKKQTGSRPLPESTLPRSLPQHNTGLRSPAESEPVQPQLLPKQRTGPRPLPEIAQPQLLPKKQTGSRPLPESTLPRSLPHHNTGLRSPAESEPVQPQLLPKQRTGSRPLPEIAQPQLLPKQQTGSRPIVETEPAQPQLLTKQKTGVRPLPQLSQPQLLSKQQTGSRPLTDSAQAELPTKQNAGSRPLPDPKKYAANFNKIPKKIDHTITIQSSPWQSVTPSISNPKAPSYSSSSQSNFDDRYQSAELKPHVKSGGLVVKSLMEREMEMERQRQREWEENQKEMKENISRSQKKTDDGEVFGRLDVSQWVRFTDSRPQSKGIQEMRPSKRNTVCPKSSYTER